MCVPAGALRLDPLLLALPDRAVDHWQRTLLSGHVARSSQFVNFHIEHNNHLSHLRLLHGTAILQAVDVASRALSPQRHADRLSLADSCAAIHPALGCLTIEQRLIAL